MGSKDESFDIVGVHGKIRVLEFQGLSRKRGVVFLRGVDTPMHTMMNTLKQKRNRANGMLAKLRYYLSADILKTIYDVHFDSHMRYACHIWDQSHNKTSDMIHSAQSKALRFISFKQSMEPSESLYQKFKINKFKKYHIKQLFICV